MDNFSASDIQAAHEIIEPLIHHTPVMSSHSLNELAGAELFFKCEHLQLTGSFKFRGASHAVQCLASHVTSVATHSSGNHGAALARAAQVRGLSAHIVVPRNANSVKVDAIRHYGGEVVWCDNTLQARENTLAQVLELEDSHVVHPYDDLRIIAGQGTLGLEMWEQTGSLDCVITPVGGGGMLAGVATYMADRCEVFGAEPLLADDAHRSFRSGTRVTEMQTDTIADGLRATLGERNFVLIQRHVEDIFCVTEEEIVAAMKLLWTRLKQTVEPSAAVTLAALLKHKSYFQGKRVGLVLSGGNLDPNQLDYLHLSPG